MEHNDNPPPTHISTHHEGCQQKWKDKFQSTFRTQVGNPQESDNREIYRKYEQLLLLENKVWWDCTTLECTLKII